MTNDKLEGRLGGRIKEVRRSLHLSQSELGSLVGGMSQAWVSRVEQNQLSPDRQQLEALESVLGPLSLEQPLTPAADTLEPNRGPAAYKAARLATENRKRRADLAMRMEKIQEKGLASIESLSAEREEAAAFVQDFVQQAVQLPAEIIADLQPLGLGAFNAVDEETQSLIDARNGVVQQLGIQLGAAASNMTSAGVTADVATTAFGVFSAVEAIAEASTGTAIVKISRTLSTVFGIRINPYTARRLGVRGLGGAGAWGASSSLIGIVGPALIAAGVAATVAGPRLLSKAQDERSQLLEASLEVDQLQVVIDEFCTQAETATSLLAHARKFGTDELERLKESVVTGNEVDIETLVKVVALTLTLLPLPVPGGPSESAPLGITHRANELALETAEHWLVEAGVLK